MGTTPKERLLEIFNNALSKENANFVYVQVKMDGFDDKEIIVNPKANFQKKLDYYDKAYDDDLKLKANPSIQITGYGWAECFEDIDFYVNDTRQEVSLVFSVISGEIEGVTKVFKHRDDANDYVEHKNSKGFISKLYAETYEVHRCGVTII